VIDEDVTQEQNLDNDYSYKFKDVEIFSDYRLDSEYVRDIASSEAIITNFHYGEDEDSFADEKNKDYSDLISNSETIINNEFENDSTDNQTYNKAGKLERNYSNTQNEYNLGPSDILKEMDFDDEDNKAIINTKENNNKTIHNLEENSTSVPRNVYQEYFNEITFIDLTTDKLIYEEYDVDNMANANLVTSSKEGQQFKDYQLANVEIDTDTILIENQLPENTHYVDTAGHDLRRDISETELPLTTVSNSIESNSAGNFLKEHSKLTSK
jgi:hypothetical protein